MPRWTAELVTKLAQLSGQVALNVENADSVAEQLARGVGELFGDCCTVLLRDDPASTRLRLSSMWHPVPGLAKAVREIYETRAAPSIYDLAGRVFSVNEFVLIPEVSSGEMDRLFPEAFREIAAAHPIYSWLVVPMRVGDRVEGALTLGRLRPDEPIDAEEAAFVQTLADHASLALCNVRLQRHERQARAEAEARTAELATACQELEAFSYAVAHDLRGPTRTIEGLTEVFLADHGDGLPEEGLKLIGRIVASSRHMAAVIDDLMTLSGVSRRELTRRPVRLSDLARAILSELQLKEPDRVVSTRVDACAPFDADAGLMHLAFENLLNNAWKFTRGREHAMIDVLIHESEVGLELEFRDNGAGFDMAYAAKLFTPFERLHRRSEFEGTGIGLATVDRIVRRHGGSIRGEAVVGHGARFFIALPRAR